MDTATKNLKLTVIFAILIVVLVAIIETMTTIIDAILGFDASYYIGMGVAATCGIAVPIVIIILASVARVNMNKNPKLLMGMTIGILVLSFATMAVFYGAVQITRALIEDIALAGSGHGPIIPMRIVSLVCLIIVIPMAILMVVSDSRNIKIGQVYILPAKATGTARAAPSSVKSDVTEEHFCSQCGAKNSAGAKFCNNCGQPL